MPKTVIIGAGSGFGTRLSIDILAYPELREGTIALVDIDPEQLAPATAFVEKVVALHGAPVNVIGTTDRREVLEGADFVVVAIAVGGPAYNGVPYYYEINIPSKYGISQDVGDTLGPGGIFRALRTAPEMVAIARDMEELCPNALLLNYTNPMAMLCWILNEASTVRNVGLCHSVQGTTAQLAGYMGKPLAEIGARVAGLNHMAWFLELTWKGQDAYPILRQAMEDPEIYAKDIVRFEIFRHFDYFVTESSRHMSEYVPYFRKNAQALEQFGIKQRQPEKEPARRGRFWEDSPLSRQLAGKEPINLKGSHEYASHIIHSVWTDTPGRINGNVRNSGCISNLPPECCVEVPCLVDRMGIQPCCMGALPTQLAALNAANVAVQSLTVQAFLEKDRRKAYHALLLDPVTAAICTPAQIKSLFDEMCAALRDWIPWLG
ncbi:MAG TPA: alpha-galactosidase [Armatimonadota bacterium]|jgi:alpha-galactosidase|nr:alpha-galactosidase [Armatimonadota bacterium]HOJ20740.1 alpha-galactosidase [Armatimonadota bacterium]HOM80680.1 alpha-galactosidase [Armatimonadota bacterium]HPO73824.1 alpha-galactosidase [Armatimonadota bacterium]HPT96264.1 alpha-galactosidase [Armatimonadota bacterium]